MAEDFFGALGKKISKATQSAVDKTSSLVETTRINSQISGEQKEIDKILQEIGRVVFNKVNAGELSPGEEESALIEKIHGHEDKIREFRQNLASVKGMKICPECEELIALDVAFCPKCGAPTPVPKAEEVPIEAEEGQNLTEAMEEAVEEAADAASAAAAEAADCACEAAEAAGEAAEAVGEAVKEAAEEAVEKAGPALDEAMDAVFTTIDEPKES